MNRNKTRRNIIRRLICTMLVTTTIATTMYSTGIIISATGAESHTESTIESNNESDVVRLNSATEIGTSNSVPCITLLSNDEVKSINVLESVADIQEEVIEVDTPLVMASQSDEVQSEPVMSDEEKQIAISYVSESYTMYCNVTTSYLNIRSSATTGIDNIVGGLYYADEVTVIGYNTYDPMWSVIEYKGNKCFVYNEYLSEEVDISLKISSYENPKWDGVTKLNSVNGRIQGPSGTETYYNLPMDKVVYYMNQLGYYYEVWVRDDGCKMFGDYIMIAANLDIRPKGTLVETSLGMGIVVDTGEFVNYDSTGIDIAVTW